METAGDFELLVGVDHEEVRARARADLEPDRPTRVFFFLIAKRIVTSDERARGAIPRFQFRELSLALSPGDKSAVLRKFGSLRPLHNPPTAQSINQSIEKSIDRRSIHSSINQPINQ